MDIPTMVIAGAMVNGVINLRISPNAPLILNKIQHVLK